MRSIALGFATVSMLALGPRPAESQFRIGPQASWGSDADLGVGARAQFGLGNARIAERPLTGQISGDYFLDACDGCTWVEITPTVFVPFTSGASVTPYAGAGLNFSYLKFDALGVDVSDTSIGLGLVGGVLLPLGGMSGVAEARFDLSGGEQLVLTFALLLGGGGS